MRYRELLLAVIVVAVGAWFFASPSSIWSQRDLSIQLQVEPGADLASTWFLVTLQGSDRYWDVEDRSPSLSFQFQGKERLFYSSRKVETAAPRQYRIRASDLQARANSYFNDKTIPLDVTGPTYCWVITSVTDSERTAPYSRSASYFAVKSPAVPFALLSR